MLSFVAFQKKTLTLATVKKKDKKYAQFILY